MSLSTHISEIAAKVHRRKNTRPVLRCIAYNVKNLLPRTFLVYVRPMLEYCSAVWLPCEKIVYWKGAAAVYQEISCIEINVIRKPFEFFLVCSIVLFTLWHNILLQDCFGTFLRYIYIYEFINVSKTEGHAYKCYKIHCSNNSRNRFFLLKQLSNCVKFLTRNSKLWYGSFGSFKHSISYVDFTDLLKYT